MSPNLRKRVDVEKRHHFRQPVQDWLLLFNNDSTIDMAQVINISQGGALCASLADACPPDTVEEVELYGHECSLSVDGLCGKIIHTNHNKLSPDPSEELSCFIFGFQFFQTSLDQLRLIEKITRKSR